MTKQYMAVDQYGYTYHGLKNPRKDLMDRIGVKHANKMYVDLKGGGVREKGYVIGQHWLSVYEVKPFKAPVKKRGAWSRKKIVKRSCRRK